MKQDFSGNCIWGEKNDGDKDPSLSLNPVWPTTRRNAGD